MLTVQNKGYNPNRQSVGFQQRRFPEGFVSKAKTEGRLAAQYLALAKKGEDPVYHRSQAELLIEYGKAGKKVDEANLARMHKGQLNQTI